MPTDRLQRVLIWLLIAAVGVFLLERLFVLMTLFATPLLLFALAWLIALVLPDRAPRLQRRVLKSRHVLLRYRWCLEMYCTTPSGTKYHTG